MLATALKEGTKKSHTAAENTKFVSSFLRGVLNPEEYRKLLTNFYYVYDVMEFHIKNSDDPRVKSIYYPELERKKYIEEDLEYYYGPEWRDMQEPSEAAATYFYRIHEVAEQDPYLLIAHHYTRYIGDLSGGKILKGITERVLKPPVGKGLKFYEFPDIPNAKDFKNNYRSMYGAGFSIAPKFTQSAWFRYHNEDDNIPNIFFSAAGSHPGAGLPGVLSSAKVVENILKKRYGVK